MVKLILKALHLCVRSSLSGGGGCCPIGLYLSSTFYRCISTTTSHGRYRRGGISAGNESDYRMLICRFITCYSGTWELGTPTRLWKTVLNSGVVLFLRSISVYWIGLGTEVTALNSQVVPISQVASDRFHCTYLCWGNSFINFFVGIRSVPLPATG